MDLLFEIDATKVHINHADGGAFVERHDEDGRLAYWPIGFSALIEQELREPEPDMEWVEAEVRHLMRRHEEKQDC